MQPQTFYRAVADDFSAVDEIIKKQLTSRVPLVSKIGDYITSAGGKRLRPLLVLLCGKALGREGDDLRLLAATIEFLHTATLLHDDVVDMSGMRRGRSTANALWGNAPSVLVGDFLYSRSFEMMVELGSMPVMQILSKATRVIAEGEVLQLSRVRDASTTEDVYMEVIRGKTAMLFEASTHSAAALAQATDGLQAQATVEHLHRLIGSVAFFGATPLEMRGHQLIEAINRDGVAMHLPRLLALRSDLIGYLNYLSALGNG